MYENKEVVIFDLDGTLIDSLPVIIEAYRECLGDLFGKRPSKEEVTNHFGKSTSEALEGLTPKGGSKERLKEEMYRRVPYNYFEEIRLREEAVEILEELKNDYKLALVTNSPRHYAESILEEMGLEKYFSRILTNDDANENRCGRSSKAYNIENILKELDVDSEEAIYIGDEEGDRESSEEVGVESLIIGEDIESLKELIRRDQGEVKL